jgi:hemerythrin
MPRWRPSLATGVLAVDAQHQYIFEQAARFEEAVNRGDPTYSLERLFAALSDYARIHFETEERLMREMAYPDVADHVREHSEFTRRLSSLIPHFEAEGDSQALLAALSGLIDSWLTQHISSSDQRIADFMRERAAGPGAIRTRA